MTSSEGHHEIAIEGLAATLGLSQTVYDEIDGLRETRRLKYTGFAVVKPADLQLALAHAGRVLVATEAGFGARHPELLK